MAVRALSNDETDTWTWASATCWSISNRKIISSGAHTVICGSGAHLMSPDLARDSVEDKYLATHPDETEGAIKKLGGIFISSCGIGPFGSMKKYVNAKTRKCVLPTGTKVLKIMSDAMSCSTVENDNKFYGIAECTIRI